MRAWRECRISYVHAWSCCWVSVLSHADAARRSAPKRGWLVTAIRHEAAQFRGPALRPGSPAAANLESRSEQNTTATQLKSSPFEVTSFTSAGVKQQNEIMTWYSYNYRINAAIVNATWSICTTWRWAKSWRWSIPSTDNIGDNSIYNCNVFLPWIPSNVLISALVLSLLPQEMVDGRDLPMFTAAHIKGSPAM